MIADITDCTKTLDLVKAAGACAAATKLDVASASSASDLARTTLKTANGMPTLVGLAANQGAGNMQSASTASAQER